MAINALIVAAGSGLRAYSEHDPLPKQYRTIGGRSVLSRTLSVFENHADINAIQVVIHPDHTAAYHAAVRGIGKLLPPVSGGADRMASVRLGLDAMAANPPDLVLIHDAARPFLSADLISRAIATARAHGGALPVLPIPDTVKRANADETVGETLDRSELKLAQTPQTFRFAAIHEAHQCAAKADMAFTDDARVAEWAGLTVRLIEGETGNRKLTTLADFDLAAGGAPRTLITRVGTGFDVHAFGPGSAVRLGGLDIPHDQALMGHSDADVVLHAVTDALYGAMADGDIGSHFPPSEAEWRGADSAIFLKAAHDQLTEQGGIIDHLDVTILCEKPKITPHRDAMRAAIAAMLDLPVKKISVKATTTERLGFTGRGEGIAAMASATIRLPEDS